jgi:subtilisin
MIAATEEVAALARRHRVSTQLESELAAQGVAQAIVFLDPMAGAAQGDSDLWSAELRELEGFFVKDERSMAAALLSSRTSLAAGFEGRSSSHRRGRQAGLVPRSYAEAPVMRAYPALRAVLGDVHTDGLERLTQHPTVRYVASSLPLRLIRPVAAAAVRRPRSTTTWGIEMLEIPRLWAAGLRGRGVRVGHLDTGVDRSHLALLKAVRDYMLTDYDGFEVPGARARDTDEHGTHTAATIAGRAVAGRYVGVAPEAQLYCTTVIEGGNGTARILAGLDWVIRQGARIINLSLGMPGYHEDFHELIEAVRGRGVLTVAAVGNDFPGSSRSPGNYDNVLSVGACDSALRVAEFSSSQWFARAGNPLVPDLVAPGVGVVSARSGGGYLELSGTSMATAHITGLAALLWGAKPSASMTDIENAISDSCTRGGMPQDRANRGLPNGVRAYELLMGVPLAAAATGKRRAVRARSMGKIKKAGRQKAKRARNVRRKKNAEPRKKK